MVFCKPLLTPVLILLALSVAIASPLLGEEEPYLGLWDWALRSGQVEGQFIYRATLRYRARAVLRSAGMLPETFRASEDSLGRTSENLDDFSFLQDSLGLGWMPPSNLPQKGHDYTTRQVTFRLDSGLVEESVVLNGTPVHPSVRLGVAEYLDLVTRRAFRTVWASEADRLIQTLRTTDQNRGGLLPELALPVEMPGPIRSIVGSGKPNLQVNGSERISFSGTSRWYPDRPVTEFQRRQSKFPQLDMKQELNLKLTGNIGDKVSVDVDQSSQASTPLANRIKIHYTGYEDEVLQRVELGNTSLSLPGTQYVSYSGRHEGLFGINAQALLGEIELTGIMSKQEGRNDTKSITKGAELRTIEIEDWQCKSGKFFFLVDPDSTPLLNLDVASVEVWIDDRDGANNSQQLTIPGYMTLSGSSGGPDSLRAKGDFNQLVINEDFIVQTDVYTGYPVLILSDRQVLDGRMTKAMGVRYRRLDGVAVGGFLDHPEDPAIPDSLVLKMIRPANEMGGANPLDLAQGVFAATRRLELRNIYDLGSNLSQEGLTVKIKRKATVGGASDPDRIGDHTYLEILGLDLYTSAGEGAEQTPGPDGRIDEGRIDYETGYVIFRELQPFAPSSADLYGNAYHGPRIGQRPDTLTSNLAAPAIYLRNDWSQGNDPSLVSRFRFEVQARRVESRIFLGFNLLPGTENVTSGGRTLIKDRDYTIDYDTGEIEILDAADVRDTDEIRVSYSTIPFGGAGSQKTLMGTALRYRPEGSKYGISTTWVYESKGSPGVEGRRPRLGQEPTRTVVGELAGTYKADSWLLTTLVDALPGVSTRQKSSITLDAGLGLSFPNPNTRGQLYVDDFEGAKDEFIVSMNRFGWKPSGIPEHALGVTQGEKAGRRGECWWYSPRSAVKEGDLQPTDERSGGLADTEKDNNRQILELHFFPTSRPEEFETSESWFSLVQPLSTRGTDLSRAQFLDLWVNDFIQFDRLDEREGRIHLEIGVFSENAIWRRIRPEQLPDSSHVPPLPGNLDTEDSSQDGQLDDPGGGQGEDRGLDYLTDAEEGVGVDPAFDNWQFVEGNEDDDRLDPKDDANRTERYRQINGTQGNGRLDTEDLNGNLILDATENYFHFVVDLADTSLVEFESSKAPDQDPKYSSYTRGWRRFRIPLTPADSTKVGIPSWEQVRHIRIWGEGFTKETYLQIGGIDITGNRWYKSPIRDSLGVEIPEEQLDPEEDFFPAVLNNKDNSTSEYNPPFKPRERQDVEEREQSLTLEMRRFEAGHQGSVFRTYRQPQDFATLYRTLEFYLNQRIREGPTPDLDFFVRFSRDAVTDTLNFYEYRVPVPDSWELRVLDLAELSRLQVEEGCRADSCRVSKTLGDGAVISRNGSPNLTSIQRITFGVANRGPTGVVSGNVWIDELRLTGVKRDTGKASRVALGLTLADLASLNLNFQQTDADFLRIGTEQGSGRTQTNLSFNSRMNVDRFITGGGLNVPLTYSMSRARTVPKFKSNSDLVLETATDRDLTESSRQDFTFSVSRNRSQNRWLHFTLDAISLSGNLGKEVANTPTSRLTSARRSGNLQYTVPLGGGPPLRVYRKAELRLLPTSLAMNLTGDITKTTEFGRRDGDLTKEFVEIPRKSVRNGRMSWSTSVRPVDPVTYNFNQTRDLRLGLARRKLLGLNVGTETSRSHKLSASHQINLLQKSLAIAPKVTWNSGFDGSFNMIRATGNEITRTNRFNNSSTLAFSGALPIGRLFKAIGSLGGGGGDDQEAPADTTGGQETLQRTGARSASQGGGFFSIGAVTATYSITKSNSLEGVTGEPSIGYQLGWARDPGPDVRRPADSFRAASGEGRNLNLSTDVKLLREVAIRTSFVRGYNKNSVNGGVTENRTRRFPDLSINWGRLHTKLGLDKVARELRATSSYSRSSSEQTTTGGTGGTRTSTTVAMNPFLNLDAKLVNGVSTKLTSRYERRSTEQILQGISNTNTSRTRQIGLTLSRSVNLSRMVTNPITKKRSRVTSKLDLSLTANYGDDKAESEQGGRATPGRHNVRFDVSTSAGYNFTSSISGNAAISFGQNTDKKNRANTVRSVSVTVSAAFRF